MRIIRKDELKNELREDGMTVMKHLSFNVNFETKNIGFLPIGLATVASKKK